jgi:hypothetical protein
MNDPEGIRDTIRRMRALVLASREKIATLGPAWSAHLAGEMVRRLGDAIDDLERDLGTAEAAVPTADSTVATPAAVPAHDARR